MTDDLVSDEQLAAMQYRFDVCMRAPSPTVSMAGGDGILLIQALRDARDENRRLHSQRRHLVAMLAKHSRYRAPAEDRFDCCAECNRGSASYVPYPCQVRIDLEAALAAPTGQEGD